MKAHLLTIFALLVICGEGLGQCDGHEQQKFTASDNDAGDYFGFSIDTDGDIMVVGAFLDSDNGASSGSAYVFRFDGRHWIEEQKLLASDGTEGDFFAYSVAVHGDIIVIGAFSDDDKGDKSGSAYVFRFEGSTWVEKQKLTASDGAANDGFGLSVALSRERIIVGAPYDKGTTGPGSVYAFEFDGIQWTERHKFQPSDGEPWDSFGRSVAIDGDLVLIGSPYDDDAGELSGSAYLFAKEGPFWVEDKITASDAAQRDEFGWSVDIDGGRLVIGASGDDDNGTDSGSAYLLQNVGGIWEQVKLTASDGEMFDSFGRAVALDGGRVLVGARWNDDDRGAAYAYQYNGTGWVEQQKLTASDSARNEYFGIDVAIAGDLAVLGSYVDDNGIDSGAVYVHPIADLVLTISPESPAAGDGILIETCDGGPTLPVALFYIALQGSPFYGFVTAGTFRADGSWVLQTTVPTGLSGVEATFKSFGFLTVDRLGRSNPEIVSFQ